MADSPNMHSLQTSIGGAVVIGSPSQLLELLDDILRQETATTPMAAAQVLDCLTCSVIRRPSRCELCSFSGLPCRYGDGATPLPGVQAPPTPGSPALRQICDRAPDLETALMKHGTDALLTLIKLIHEEFPDHFTSMLDIARLATAIAYRLGFREAGIHSVTMAALFQDLGLVLVLARAEAGRPPSWKIPRGRDGRRELTDRLLAAGGASELIRRIVDGRGTTINGTDSASLVRAAAIVRISRHIHDRLHGPTDSRSDTPASLAGALRDAAAADADPHVLRAAAEVVAAFEDRIVAN
ncbi:MAG: hypothetical protein JNK67_18145 [Alphaproteobacteria bacterium]|nr:hypothetical protein [Alphaproteobacteria bacterium]